MKLTTNLALLRKANACDAGMSTLMHSLGPDWPDEADIDLSYILKSNGLDHAIWAMQATTVYCKQQIVYMAMDFALSSLDNFEKLYPEDKRPRLAIEAAGAFVDGKITKEELKAAARSAESAAWSARSAESAARSAESAESAARSAAWSAESAARAAAWSAESAAWSARSAWSAAWSAESAAESAESAAWSRNNEIFLKHVS